MLVLYHCNTSATRTQTLRAVCYMRNVVLPSHAASTLANADVSQRGVYAFIQPSMEAQHT